MPDLLICNRYRKNRIIEYFISALTNIKFGIEDFLSGFKVYNLKKLKKIKFNKFKNYYLVDLVLYFKLKNFKIKNYLIKTEKRNDYPKIGNSLKVNVKLIKIFFNILLFH